MKSNNSQTCESYFLYDSFKDPANYVYSKGENSSLAQPVKLLASSGGFKYGCYKEVQDLIHYLNACPTAWQAVDETANRLKKQGYIELKEIDPYWTLEPEGKYYVIRGGSSLIAFTLPKNKPTSMLVLGAHTDSPGFKLKPKPEIKRENYLLLSTQIYGAPIQPAWFNRSLGLAGRCTYLDAEKNIQALHVNIAEPIGSFPHLAIHMNRDLSTKVELNPQNEMNALVACNLDLQGKSYVEALIEEAYGVTPLPGFELFLVPLEKAILTGPAHETIESPRLDNLLSCDASLQALLGVEASKETIQMLSLWDSEEIGSHTAQGAASTFLQSILNRIFAASQLTIGEQEAFMRRSFIVSNDVAHGYHPNYSQAYEGEHKCLFGHGVVIKINANQRYATDAITEAKVTECFKTAGVPISQFVIRSDSVCGSTIGNIVATRTGIPTVDVGVPILSMHSPIEKGSIPDQLKMIAGLKALLAQ